MDLRLLGVLLHRNGVPIESAAGAAALGSPARCVAWVANELGAIGRGLRRGDIVLAGPLHRLVPVRPGDDYQAEFAHLGTVTVQFSGGARHERRVGDPAKRRHGGTGTDARRIADALIRAQIDRAPIPPFTRKMPFLRLDTAYEAQALARRAPPAGRREGHRHEAGPDQPGQARRRWASTSRSTAG